ncbi:hypothetical protein BpHYR1_018789 [Brachionus plicatilis]|uniref:Uncharacterized protein n=1 Tax=Brachionus plicatilis TaxID=10195 RepID=A0A3M7SJZ6_BRAPC|nr:hypothetical protein BpHYR1_018789 [Brachionus plicatilis]
MKKINEKNSNSFPKVDMTNLFFLPIFTSYFVGNSATFSCNLSLIFDDELFKHVSFQGLPERLRSETEPVSSYRFLVEEPHFGDTPDNLAFSFKLIIKNF